MSEISVNSIDDVFGMLVEMWRATVPLDSLCAQMDGNPDLFEGIVTKKTYIEYFLSQFKGPYSFAVDLDVVSQLETAWRVIDEHGDAVAV